MIFIKLFSVDRYLKVPPNLSQEQSLTALVIYVEAGDTGDTVRFQGGGVVSRPLTYVFLPELGQFLWQI